jgi:K+-transporting ATPase ATPase C chain
MFRAIRPAVVILVTLTLLLGVLYPLVVTGLGQLLFASQANGSLITNGDRLVGSSLIGQANNDPRYFWPRPSATGYGTLPSGASNLGPTSLELAGLVRQRSADFRAAHQLPPDASVPAEMLFASGSGLDPHISPNAARLQVGRVATARSLDAATVAALVDTFVESPQMGFFGQPRVNVLLLNIALDGLE